MFFKIYMCNEVLYVSALRRLGVCSANYLKDLLKILDLILLFSEEKLLKFWMNTYILIDSYSSSGDQ